MSSDKLDKAIEKIKQGNTSLAMVSDLITLENADARSDALLSKFTKDPSQMNSTDAPNWLVICVFMQLKWKKCMVVR